MDVYQEIFEVAARGGLSVVRVEVARILSLAVAKLSRRGGAARELAIIAEAVGRSDEEVAAEMARLSDRERAQLVLDFRSAAEDGVSETEGRQDPDFLHQVLQLHRSMSNQGLLIGTNSGVAASVDRGGQMIVNTGSGNLTINGDRAAPVLIAHLDRIRLEFTDRDLAREWLVLQMRHNNDL